MISKDVSWLEKLVRGQERFKKEVADKEAELDMAVTLLCGSLKVAPPPPPPVK